MVLLQIELFEGSPPLTLGYYYYNILYLFSDVTVTIRPRQSSLD